MRQGVGQAADHGGYCQGICQRNDTLTEPRENFVATNAISLALAHSTITRSPVATTAVKSFSGCCGPRVCRLTSSGELRASEALSPQDDRKVR